MADQVTTNTIVSTENAESLAPVATPTAQAESLAPIVLASNEQLVASTQVLRAVPSASPAAENYSVVVKAPPAGGMLAYLVGPGASIELQGIDLNKSTLAQEGGNLRITLPNGAEVLLLDYVSSAKDPSTVVVTSEGKLPAQTLLAALDGTQVAGKDVTDVEPAAGPTAGGEGGGLTPPTILGLGVGEGEGIFSSVIGPFGIPVARDSITTNEYPFEPSLLTPVTPPVVPANNPPIARNDAFSTAINKPVTMTPAQILANDSDADGDTLTIVSVQGALNGTVSIVGGNVVFVPTTGFTGTGSYSYTITDGHGGTSTADVIVQIDPTFPGQNTTIAADDTGTVVAGRAITVNVLANDSDPEGDALVPGSVRIISGPDKGTATVNADGTINYQSVGTDAYFTTVVYEVTDARGAKDTATVTIEVIPAANNVIAVDDTGEIIPAGASKSFNVTNNDVDPQGDSFKISAIVTGPTKGTATFDPATGNIVYNSVASATGYTEVITYEITDARGAKDTATLTIRVEPSNNVSAVDDTADLKAGQDVNIKVLNNDFDAQGDTFSITRIVSGPQVRDGSGFGGARGSVKINSDGTITFTDDAGARDSAVVEFTYEIVDSKGATDIAVVRVTIGTAPNGVDANNDTLTVAENSARADVTTKLLANDFDPQGDTFKVTSVTQPTTGRGTVELVGDKVFFTPATDYNGPVTFTYTITDSKGATDTAQVTINVQETASTSLNAGDDTFNTGFNTNLTITPAQLLSNDNDPQGTTLNASNIISFTQPAHGTVTLVNGNYVYNPDNSFRGTDTFTYTIKDAQGDIDTATVTIRVADPLPQDNPVDAVDDLVILKPGETRSVNALTNDSAPDGGLAFVRLVDPLPAGVTDLGGGRFSYTAPSNATGQTVSFRYEVRDADGDTDIATVTFKVEGAVNSVDARDDAVTMAKDVNSILINAAANDVDPEGDAFSITRIVSVSSGTATIENGQIRYNNGTRDAGTATIVYEITDSKGAKDTATITIKIEADTNSVIANDDAVTMAKDVNSILINAKANDVDPQGDAFSITRIVSVSSGTATIENGQIRYVNGTRDAGTATIVYEITDSKGAKDTATITVKIEADTNSVIANDDNVTMAKDVNSILINAKANDTDPQGDAFSITRIVSVTGGGTATIENGQVRYINNSRDAGVAYITYEVTDAKGAKDTAVIKVTIAADTNSVIANDDNVTMAKDVNSILINAKANDTDPQGDAFSITRIVSVTGGGTATIENGQVRYNNTTRDAGVAYITYEVTDAKGAKDTAVIKVNITADTNSVIANDDAVTMAKDVNSILINAKANDVDPQGDSFSITRIVSVAGGGSATIENGQIRYTNGTRDSGTATIVYEITDSKGAKDTATITIKIAADTNTVDALDDFAVMGHDVNSILINAKANDFDAQGDAFSITRIVSVSGGGSATIENGQVRYTNSTRDSGVAYITYEITDAKGAKDTAVIKVTINADTNSVIANDDNVTMAKDVNSILINAKANDTDPQGDAFSITRIVSVSGGGSATIENGQVRYTNSTRDSGVAYITYEITDAKGAKDTAVIKVTINADTNSVIANDDNVTMAKDVNSILINAKANDTDPQGDAFSITRIVSVSGGGSATIENGQVRYTNSTRDSGVAYITYEITDSKGAKDTAVIKVNIGADTNTVTAVDDKVTMAKDVNSILINAKANDFDAQGDAFSITKIISVSSGTASIENGQIRYTNGTRNDGTATIVYEITDSKGAKDTATITVNIKADTNSVIANDDTVTMAKDVNKITIDAKKNDVDPQGDSFSITKIISVSEGKATIVDGKIVYENGTRDADTAKIVYEITDSKGAKDTATITVNIKADTNSVVAVDDKVTMAKDVKSITIDAAKNDYDPQKDSFKITKIVSVSDGSAKIVDGKIVYTNDQREAGTAKIVYEITDSKGAKDTATVTVNIAADTNSVIANNDSARINEQASVRINVLANDSDPQGDSFSISRIVSGPSRGSASINSDGTITYRAASTNSNYTATFVYEIVDKFGAKDTATVTVNVVANRDTGGGGGGGGGDGGGGDCPLTIDLNGNGISILMQAQSQAHFDLDGNGYAEWTSWVNGSDDAIVAIDRNGNGSIDGISEVFGGNGVDGFTELGRLEDTNNDGMIDAKDANWNQLKLWLDANANGISEEGELHSMADLGVTGISLNANETSIQYGDAYISHQGSVTMADGSTRTASSVFYTNDSNGVLKGTDHSDVLIYSSTADSIDGGQGADTLKVMVASDIVIGHDTVHGVETIDLANKGADKLTLNINDVLTMSDTGILTVQGDAVDQIVLTGDATRGDDVTQGGHTYASYTAGNGGTVLVELGLSVNTDQHH